MGLLFGIIVGVLTSYLIFTLASLDVLRFAGPIVILIGYFVFRKKYRAFANGLLWSILVSIIMFLVVFIYAFNSLSDGFLRFL